MYMFALISRCMVKFHIATDSASMLKQVALLTLMAKGIWPESLQIERLPGCALLQSLARPSPAFLMLPRIDGHCH